MQNKFQAVFPVKCNHSKELIDSILEYGNPAHNLGLEAGSKAELVLAMSMLSKYPSSNLICNGYKDAEYIELVSVSIDQNLLGPIHIPPSIHSAEMPRSFDMISRVHKSKIKHPDT